MTGIEQIVEERQKQLQEYSIKDDLKYESGELKTLVEFLLMEENNAEKEDKIELLTEFGGVQFTKNFLTFLNNKAEIDKLKIAGALIAAEIDRLQYKN